MRNVTEIGVGIYSYLSPADIKELRRRCKIAGLHWQAQAVRPVIARQLLNDRRLDATKATTRSMTTLHLKLGATA